jgi:hypothetical protein
MRQPTLSLNNITVSELQNQKYEVARRSFQDKNPRDSGLSMGRQLGGLAGTQVAKVMRAVTGPNLVGEAAPASSGCERCLSASISAMKNLSGI